MNRYHLLAAETYCYSFANYEDHLGIGNVRFEKLMPDTVRVPEAAEREGWPVEKVARKLDWDVDRAADFQRRFRRALARWSMPRTPPSRFAGASGTALNRPSRKVCATSHRSSGL